MSDFSINFAPSAGRASRSGSQGGFWARLAAMFRARQTRHVLAEMDDRLLADIGIGRGDALAEAARPMWDLSPRRR